MLAFTYKDNISNKTTPNEVALMHYKKSEVKEFLIAKVFYSNNALIAKMANIEEEEEHNDVLKKEKLHQD